MIVITSEDHFNEEFDAKKDKLVFAYFTATWCRPCKMISPLVDDLSQMYRDKIEFLKIDLDDNDEVALRFEVTSIPAFILFEKGEIVERASGADEEKVKAMIEKRV